MPEVFDEEQQQRVAAMPVAWVWPVRPGQEKHVSVAACLIVLFVV